MIQRFCRTPPPGLQSKISTEVCISRRACQGDDLYGRWFSLVQCHCRSVQRCSGRENVIQKQNVFAGNRFTVFEIHAPGNIFMACFPAAPRLMVTQILPFKHIFYRDAALFAGDFCQKQTLIVTTAEQPHEMQRHRDEQISGNIVLFDLFCEQIAQRSCQFRCIVKLEPPDKISRFLLIGHNGISSLPWAFRFGKALSAARQGAGHDTAASGTTFGILRDDLQFCFAAFAERIASGTGTFSTSRTGKEDIIENGQKRKHTGSFDGLLFH